MTKGAKDGDRSGIRGWHVLLMLVGFFVAVATVDGFMIYQAESTFGGIETPDAYRKGVAYNESIAQDVKQTEAGWKDDIKVVGSPLRLQVALRDKGDGAIAGKHLVATVGRPATDRFDMTVSLAETAPGVYEAPLAGASEGTWIIDLSAYDSGSSSAPVYQARRRAWIGP